MLVLLLALPSPGPLVAPAPPQASAPGPSRGEARAYGLEGAGYRARFDATGVGFTALDPAGVELGGLRLELLSVGRRDGTASLPEVSGRKGDAASFRFERGSLVELYEEKPVGLEQSFVFDELPPGTGDLLVRVRVRTSLPTTFADVNELRFGLTTRQDLRISDVYGVAANGTRVPGNLSWSDSARVLELALPASFVDRAALPLVLDPLIGGAAAIMGFRGGPADDTELDLAYLPGADRYFLGSIIASLPSSFAMSHVLGPSGAPLSAAAISSPGTIPSLVFSNDVCVASSVGSQRFAIGIHGGNYLFDLWLTSSDANHQFPPPIRFFASILDMDMAGEIDPGHDGSLVAFTTAQGLRPVFVHALELDPVGIVNTARVAEDGTIKAGMALPENGGLVGRYLLVWDQGAAIGAQKDIYGAVLDRGANVLVPPFPIATDASTETAPDVDGDGTNWVVVFEREVTLYDRDLYCVGVSCTPGGVQLTGERLVAGEPGVDELEPAIAWMGESYLIGYSEQTNQRSESDVKLVSIESLECKPCEGTFPAFDMAAYEEGVALVSHRTAGGREAEALVVVHSTSGGESNILSQRFQVHDGSVVDLGGGCGAAAR